MHAWLYTVGVCVRMYRVSLFGLPVYTVYKVITGCFLRSLDLSNDLSNDLRSMTLPTESSQQLL